MGTKARINSYIEGDFTTLSDRLGLPFLLKPRKGYASKGHVGVKAEQDFAEHKEYFGNVLMAQPLVGDDSQEFTVGVFGDGTGSVNATVTLQRQLAIDGSTAKASVANHPSLDLIVKELCLHFKPIGPTNLQFRKVKNG